MASASAFKTYHGTLTANTVDTVSLTVWTRYVLVINKSSDVIYATTDGSTPAVKGEDTYCVPANTSKLLFNEGVEPEPALSVSGATVVKLISTGTPDYSVEKN